MRDHEFAAALERVVARTKHQRFRELCDPQHPDFDPSYIAVVLQADDNLDQLHPSLPTVPAALPLEMGLRQWYEEAVAMFRGCGGCGGRATAMLPRRSEDTQATLPRVDQGHGR